MTDPTTIPPADTGSHPAGSATAHAAEEVIERFGGIRPMAAKLNIPVTTVQGWKKRGHIPESRRDDILAAAHALGIPLSEAELDRATSPQPEEAEHAGPTDTPPAHPPVIDIIPERVETRGEEAVAQRIDERVNGPRPQPNGTTSPGTPPGSPPPAAAAATAPRGNHLGAAAFVVAIVGLGIGLFGLIRHGDLPGMSGRAQTDARPVAADPVAAAPVTADPALRAELDGLARQLAEAQAQIARVAEQPAVSPRVDIALPDGLEALPAEVKNLSTRLDALSSATPPDLTEVRAEMAALATLVSDLANRPAASGDGAPAGADPARVAALEAAVAELSARLDQVEQRQSTLSATTSRAGEGEALLIASAQLQAALADGRPFTTELQSVQALAAGVPELQAPLAELVAAAPGGLATTTALQTRFNRVAADIIRADRQREDAGWVDQTLGRVSSLVTVRRASGEVAGDGVDAVVARAEAALGTGDLSRAVAELSTLTGPPAAAAADWLTAARARLAAERAARTLTEQAIALLSGRRG